MTSALQTWRRRYTAAGLATIPLAAGTKRAIVDAWQKTPPSVQWSGLPRSFAGNIGILAGNGTAIIDCDAPGTIEAVRGGLNGLGITPPTVHTPSGGQHFYIRASDVPKSFNWSRLAVGPGELRAHNSYACAPSSTVEGIHYRWENKAGPELVEKQPAIAWRDLAWLIGKTPAKTQPLITSPVRLVWRSLPAKADDLLHALRSASKGEAFAGYASRSEAEAAVVAHLILSGWSLREITATFDQALPGHYRSYHTQASRSRYLQRTFTAVLTELASNPERYELANWYHAAELGDWPGRGGMTDRAVYLALCAIGWQASSYTPFAAYRNLAEHAAIEARSTTAHSLDRLLRAGLIRRLTNTSQDTNGIANTYEVLPFLPAIPVNPQTPKIPVTYGSGLSNMSYLSEVWSYGKLGRTAGAVYELLGSSTRPDTGLAEKVGKHLRTIRRALAKLAQYGLAEQTPDGWRRGGADLAAVADQFDCKGEAIRRRYRHELEREAFAETLVAQRAASAAR